jgi:hypothetical protein
MIRDEIPRLPRQREVEEAAVGTQTSRANPTLAHERRLERPAKMSPSAMRPRSQGRHTIQIFEKAISELDTDTVYRMLEQCFEDVAVEEYSWLSELRKLGYSSREISDELLEASRDGPWIFSGFNVSESQPYSPGFHIKDCLHSNRIGINQTMERDIPPSRPIKPAVPTSNTQGQSTRESIEYFCGIGGVSPMPTGVHETQFGSVKFEDSNSTAIVSFRSPSKRSRIGSNLHDVLVNLTRAIGALQRSGGCCDSFTFLSLSREQSFIELHRLDLLVVENLINATEEQGSREWPLTNSTSRSISRIFGKAYHEPLPLALQAQFLCLSFLSYSQAHCGPIRPFFLDTPLRRIVLIGENEWSEGFQGPCIIGSLMNLSCFGDMLQEPTFTFQYHGPGNGTTPPKRHLRHDLFAHPEDVLDTWGPGELVTSKNDATNLHAISIGGGYAVPSLAEAGSTSNKLHWSKASRITALAAATFPRNKKVLIGTNISSKVNCNGQPHAQIRRAAYRLLTSLDTFPDYWEVTERQFGLGIQGGGPSVGLLQFNQTWVKRKGLTKKSILLAQRSLSLPDLEAFFGIQISVCTGIARRVRLRDLLAEIIPTYVADQLTKHPLWESLFTKFRLIAALKNEDLRLWSRELDYEHQKTFESLAFAVLFVLQDTGVDRDGENFIVGCIQPGIPDQCIRIPCKKENYWTRIVADSEDHATFVYMTTDCLETDLVKCHGPRFSWLKSTAFLCTAVSCCDDRNAVSGTGAAVPESWTLKDSESYLIGRVDAPLIVAVDRPNAQEEPRLLVSLTNIRPDILNRLYRKGRYGKPRRLRERRVFEQIAESVMVLSD